MFINESALFISLILITGVVTFIIGVMVYGMIQQNRHAALLQDQLNQERLRAIERERARIAETLHRNLCPSLAAARLMLSEENGGQREDREAGPVAEILKSSYQALSETATSLRPEGIGHKGPLPALQDYLEQRVGEPALSVDVIPSPLVGLTEEQSLHLYRMLLEILDNAEKHSGASKLVISCEQDEKRVVLRAADDGKGFNPEKLRRAGSLGLDDLEVHARIAGAELLIESGLGKGTSYTINVPILQ